MFRRSLKCSFCRRKDADVEKLVAGPRVYICDRCVAIAARLMAGDPAAPVPARHRTLLQRMIDLGRSRWHRKECGAATW